MCASSGEMVRSLLATTWSYAIGDPTCKVRLARLERPVFGGYRVYFQCPRRGRRCDLLYARPHIACRQCHKLAYASENETRADRALRQLFKIRDLLGQMEGGVITP